MPYIFIWASFTLRENKFESPISRITNGAIERFFRSKKQQVLKPIYPAHYINSTVNTTLGQAVLKRKNEILYDPSADLKDPKSNFFLI